MSRRVAAAGLLFAAALIAEPVRAATGLFYFELQGVAGYSTAAKKTIAYSMNRMEAMQKPGLGFDLVRRFSGKAGDRAVVAVQGRLVWNADAGESGLKRFEPQLYNAYLLFKLDFADLWVGHNKPRFGLSSVIDNHAALLQPLAMSGYGFDRDWGVGLEHDTAKGSAGLSLTTGSGMALRFKRSFFAAGRLECGVLERDNMSRGISVGWGKVQDVMGTRLMSDRTIDLILASLDLSWVRNNWENRLEILGGGYDGKGALILFWRSGLGFLEENRLKLEAQPVVRLTGGELNADLGLGTTYILATDWTLRTMAVYDTAAKDFRFVLQLYLYKGLGL